MRSVREQIGKTTLLRYPTLPPPNYNPEEIKNPPNLFFSLDTLKKKEGGKRNSI
jgi:hypothetical protein